MPSSNKDTTVAVAPEAEITQISMRIPVDLQKTVARLAIDRDTTSQQLWIDAMRAFLRLKS